MHCDYSDITSRLGTPLWWDEHAVPRFDRFHPRDVADIYADEVALFIVTCQGCGREFPVAEARGPITKVLYPHMTGLAEAIRTKTLEYGDPPNIGCCGAGPTMNSEPRRVLGYWSRHHREHTKEVGFPGGRVVSDVSAYMEWRRDPSLEIGIECDWVKAEP